MQASTKFQEWAEANAAPLTQGEKLPWPDSLGHPNQQGFKVSRMAEARRGKVRDWVRPAQSKSRFHVWEFSDGRLVIHWDRFDPAQGRAIEHLFFESRVFKTLFWAGLALTTFAFITQD